MSTFTSSTLNMFHVNIYVLLPEIEETNVLLFFFFTCNQGQTKFRLLTKHTKRDD